MRKLLCGATAVALGAAAGPAMANGSIKDVQVVKPVPVWSGCYIGVNVGGAWTGDSDFDDLEKKVVKGPDDMDDDKDEDKDKDHDNDKDKDDGKYDKGYDYTDWPGFPDLPTIPIGTDPHANGGEDPDHSDDHDEGSGGNENPSDDDYGDAEWVKVDDFRFNDHNGDETLFGGLHAGCNWEDRALVYGVEADIGFGDNIDYLASVRGRIGTVWHSWHAYLTGGVAFVGLDRDFDMHFDVEDNGKVFSFRRTFDNDHDETGYVVGLGFEKLLGLNTSFGVEGLYYWFDDDDEKHEWEDSVNDVEHAFRFRHEDDNEIFVLRARLTYHLRRPPEPLK